MKKSYIANNIMNEYSKRKRIEHNKKRSELEEFKRKVCIDCKYKNTDVCSIHRNIEGNLQCIFKSD
jgi:hypothetical protein